MKIAFDIDGTLQDIEGRPVEWVHEHLRKLSYADHDVIIWSGGGVDYASRYRSRYHLRCRVAEKCSEEVDIAFDDAVGHLKGASVTIQVPPVPGIQIG